MNAPKEYRTGNINLRGWLLAVILSVCFWLFLAFIVFGSKKAHASGMAARALRRPVPVSLIIRRPVPLYDLPRLAQSLDAYGVL